MGDSQQDRGKSSYNQWSPQESKTLISLLLDGVASGWRDSNNIFSKFIVERKILLVLNQTHGCNKTYQHNQNRIKILKAKYLSGVELLRNTSRFGWNPITKRFTASDEVWSDYIKAHPSYKKFRDETFDEFDDLKVILENNIATGGNAIGLGEGTDARTSGMTQKEQTNYVEDFLVEEDYETPSSFLHSSSRGSLEKFPLRKRRRSNTINVDEPIIKKEDAEEVNTEMKSLTSVTEKILNLIQEREARQQREAKQREVEKKKNNVWEGIKEVSDLEENVRYDAVKVIHQLGMKDVFVSMSTDERYGWIKRNVIV